MSTVRYFSKPLRLNILYAYDEETGHGLYVRFRDGMCETDDPDEVEALLEYSKKHPAEVWPDPAANSVVCPVCFKAFKDEFGLKGHMRTHEKDVPAPVEDTEE